MPDDDHAAQPPARRRKRGVGARMVVVAAFVAAVLVGVVLAAVHGGVSSGGSSADGPRTHSSERPSTSSPSRPIPSARPSSPTAGGDDRPRSLAAVGDSITRGFDACSLLADCPSASWSTGTDQGVRSLAARLLAKPSTQSHNHAVSGSRMADLPAQMRRAAADDPDLVTVMTGANDACRATTAQMTPVAEFRASFRRALRTLHTAQPRAQVYVASVPDLKRLWEQGRHNRTSVRVWGLGICQSMLKDPRSHQPADEQRRNEVRARVVAYNTVLREVCAEDERCRYDGGAVFRFRFTAAEVSDWDRFHPSRRGQQQLAELAYEQLTAE